MLEVIDGDLAARGPVIARDEPGHHQAVGRVVMHLDEELMTRAAFLEPAVLGRVAIRRDGDGIPVSLVATSFAERSPALSPDSRWLAYTSDETGIDQIYVVPFPNSGDARFVVSTNGGREPVWSRSGRELFYRDGAGDMVAAQILTDPEFTVARTTLLFSARAYRTDQLHPYYDVSPDDQRFLMVRDAQEKTAVA